LGPDGFDLSADALSDGILVNRGFHLCANCLGLRAHCLGIDLDIQVIP
jgi:hypothetical protein